MASDELREGDIAAEVALAAAEFIDLPEEVDGDGVEAHGFCQFGAHAPASAWNELVMDFPGDDLEGLAVKIKSPLRM